MLRAGTQALYSSPPGTRPHPPAPGAAERAPARGALRRGPGSRRAGSRRSDPIGDVRVESPAPARFSALVAGIKRSKGFTDSKTLV